MKAPAVGYLKPASVDAVLAALEEHGDGAQVLAGGQSLLPMLNMRLAQPAVLVDITGVPGLAGIEVAAGVLRIGALTTHRAIERSAEVARHLPLLAQAVRHVAHVAIRNVGTLGGSLALSDPAAEYPACCLALDATIVVVGRAGERRIAAADFFQGLYQTALKPGELIARAEFPVATADSVQVFQELARRHGDYALVGLAACARRSGQGAQARLAGVRLAFLGAGTRPMLAKKAAAILEGQVLTSKLVAAAQGALADELEPSGDLNASPQTKLHLARVLTARVLSAMAGA